MRRVSGIVFIPRAPGDPARGISASVFPFGFGRQPVSMVAIARIQPREKHLDIVPRDALHRQRRAFEVAGIAADRRAIRSGPNRAGLGMRIEHHRFPLGLRNLESPDLESLADAYAMHRRFVGFAARRSHPELAGGNAHQAASIQQCGESVGAGLLLAG